MIKSYIKAVTLCCALAVLGGTAKAGISFSSGGSLTNWVGTPTYVSLANGSGLASATVAQGDATNAGSSYYVMSEIFTPTSVFTLGSFNIVCTVNTATNYQVHLYNLGPAGTVSVSSSSATYTPGTDLFSGLSITLPNTGGEVQGSFTLSGADQISLTTNRQYALEIWTPRAAGAAGINWYRNAGSPADPGGQMFTGTNSTGVRKTLAGNGQAGGAPRIAALALFKPQGPNPPTSLSASGGNAVVNLTWVQSTSPGITTNKVYRSTSGSGGPYSLLASIAAATSYADTAVVNGTQYFYEVTAVNTNGESGFSNSAGATPAGPPPPPAGLAAVAGNAQVSLSWTASSGATSYNVKRSTTSGGPYTTITNVTTTSFVNTGLANGTTYYYVVSALNANGESANSPEVSSTPNGSAPAAPTGLTASAGNAQVSLSWTASSGATSYNVKRSTTSGGPYTTITNVTTTSFVDTGLANGTTYYYVVSALNTYGESANSSQVSATPSAPQPPPVPTGLTASAGNAQVSLSWTASSGATSYNVKRATTSGGPYTTITNVTTTSFVNTGLANGTTYYYVVSALNANGESANSSQVSATPSSSTVIPLVYSVENTGTNFPAPPLPQLGDSNVTWILPLPDPFYWASDPLNMGGTASTSFSDWEHHRNEIKAQIENYEIGIKPYVDLANETVTVSGTGTSRTLSVVVTNIVPGGTRRTISLSFAITLPSSSGTFPAIIGMNSASGSVNSSILTAVAKINYQVNQVTVYGTQGASDPYYVFYASPSVPALNTTNTGQYSAWAWGCSRIIDGLYKLNGNLGGGANIDLAHIGCTGCSYAGKMALFCGAFDERVALTIAQESGGGGANSWRYNGLIESNGTVEWLPNTDHNWFKDSMFAYGTTNKCEYLPEDHHELDAMVAPRALFATGNDGQVWLGTPSCFVCCKAAEQIYNTLGISDRFGYNLIGGHNHCATTTSIDNEMAAFVNKFLLGQTNVNTLIRDYPTNNGVMVDNYNKIPATNWFSWWGTTNPVPTNINKTLLGPACGSGQAQKPCQ